MFCDLFVYLYFWSNVLILKEVDVNAIKRIYDSAEVYKTIFILFRDLKAINVNAHKLWIPLNPTIMTSLYCIALFLSSKYIKRLALVLSSEMGIIFSLEEYHGLKYDNF